jgi:transcriptional regulator GlxA family with amidase domain
MKHRVGILLFDDVEMLDLAGPFEVFASAQIHGKACFEVVTFGVTSHPVFVFGGIKLLPNLSVKTKTPLNLVIVPGGYGVHKIKNNPKVQEWINYHYERGTRIASVCTGSFLLAEMGYLNGLQATTHHMDIADFQYQYPEIQVVSGVRFVDQGQIITSAGISAGIDMSLYLVQQIYGRNLAELCIKRMEWKLSNSW